MLAFPDIRQLRPEQLDALREIASMGAGHAATALSTMTQQRIMISVPTIAVSSLASVMASHVGIDLDATIAAVQLLVSGDLSGRALLVFPQPTACRLADMLLHRPASKAARIDALEASALCECGNILSGAYLNALADFMQLRLMPSTPVLAVDRASQVLRSGALRDVSGREMVFCVESEFQLTDDSPALRGHFLLLPDPASLQRMLHALHLA
jgi:chemotaxis protein CheC